MSRVLYISYDGMLEPLGQSQVLAYLKKLSGTHCIHLLSFEKAADWGRHDERAQLMLDMQVHGIHWHPLRYHKSPTAIATSWDIAAGIFMGLWLMLRHRLRIVHARSYVPSVMAMALQSLVGARFIFDMRGFWADERIDGGLWPADSRIYRVAKWFERRFLLSADHVVSLTHAAVRIMERFPYLRERKPRFTVIPTCADLNRFRPLPRPDGPSAFTLGYVGSAGTWYLFEHVVSCYAQLRQTTPDARLLIINRGEHDYIRRCFMDAGVSLDGVDLMAATHDEIPGLIARMDAGIFFIKPVFSKQASAPTKLAEFLGCGVPCLSNAGVGDMAEVLERERVGIALADFDAATLRIALERVQALVQDNDVHDRCVAAATKYFALDEGARRYADIYREVGSQ